MRKIEKNENKKKAAPKTNRVTKIKRGPKTEEKRKELKALYIEKLLECGCIAEAAQDALHLSDNTIKDWCKKDPDFAKAISEADSVAVGKATSYLWDAIKSGNVTAIIFYLKTRGSKYGFKERQTIDLNTTEIPAGMTKEEAKDFIANLNK